MGKEKIKADGLDSPNTTKQVLSKTAAFASLPPAGSCLRVPHSACVPPPLLTGAHAIHQSTQEMKSNNCKSRAYWDLLFANEISFSLKVSLTILTSERWKDELSSKWRHVVEWRWLFSQEHNTEILSLVHGTCCYRRKVPESLNVSAECSLLLKYS